MPEWLIIIAVFFIVTRLLRSRRRRFGMYRHPHRLRHARRREVRERREERRLGRPEAPAETPMQTLQRRYVAGDITVEEYERELDRLFRAS